MNRGVLDAPALDGLLARIDEAREHLRPSEATVADFVLQRPRVAVDLSIAELAQRAGVSEPTVARFCVALGFSGFKAFKFALGQTLAAGVPFVHRDVTPGDSPAEMSAKIFDRAIAALLAVRNQLDPAAIERAVQLLAKARRIELYGLGNSGIVAADGQHKFFRLGVPTVAYSDPHVHGMAATMLAAGDAVIAISQSGRTLDLIRSVELARESGADVIGLTSRGSPLAQRCTVALYADALEDAEIYAPMTSRIAHLTLIDVLAVGVALARGPRLAQRLGRMKQALREKRVRGFDG